MWNQAADYRFVQSQPCPRSACSSKLRTTLNAPKANCAAVVLDRLKDKCESVNEQMLTQVSLQQNLLYDWE